MKKIELPLYVVRKRKNRNIATKKLRAARRKGSKLVITRNSLKASKVECNVKVVAPYNFHLGKKYHIHCVKFINDLHKAVKQAANSNKTVCICFRDTKHISAPAGIYLFSSTEEIVRKYPSVTFQVRIPPAVPEQHTRSKEAVVHAALMRIGYYDLLSIKKSKAKPFPHVNTWHTCSASIVKGNLVGQALSKLDNLGIDQKALYRSGIEAMNNAIEHAYSKDVPKLHDFHTKKWWMFTGVLDNKLIFVIADKGHGIPQTLPYTQPEDVISNIRSKMRNAYNKIDNTVLNADAEAIHIATLVKKTRTTLGYRGKGGPDLRKFVESHPDAKLLIYSNFGTYSFELTKKGKKDLSLGFNNKSSIEGTIIAWEVPLPESNLSKA